VEPLSERELEVLRLLAVGLSNPEIAADLVVAASTVHSHCKSIYGKLGVHRRWDAVQRARELSLI
jgi:LuxR family maltose regulon positive regulatory protein